MPTNYYFPQFMSGTRGFGLVQYEGCCCSNQPCHAHQIGAGVVGNAEGTKEIKV